MFRIYNLNILPHTHCCRVSDEQEPLSCSLLHPRLLMCQIPGIMKWQCAHQIMLQNNRDFPRLLAHPSAQIQADPSFVESKIWSFLKLNLIQELLQESFSFITNRTNHRANDKAAGNCIFDIKILLWYSMYQWGNLCLASCLKFHGNGNSTSDLSCSAPHSNSFRNSVIPYRNVRQYWLYMDQGLPKKE